MMYDISFRVITKNDPDDTKEKVIEAIRAAGFDVSETEVDEFCGDEGGEDEE